MLVPPLCHVIFISHIDLPFVDLSVVPHHGGFLNYPCFFFYPLVSKNPWLLIFQRLFDHGNWCFMQFVNFMLGLIGTRRWQLLISCKSRPLMLIPSHQFPIKHFSWGIDHVINCLHMRWFGSLMLDALYDFLTRSMNVTNYGSMTWLPRYILDCPPSSPFTMVNGCCIDDLERFHLAQHFLCDLESGI